MRELLMGYQLVGFVFYTMHYPHFSHYAHSRLLISIGIYYLFIFFYR